MVTYRVLIYRVSIEWSHIECSHRVVTHTLHFFLFSHCLGSLAGIIDGRLHLFFAIFKSESLSTINLSQAVYQSIRSVRYQNFLGSIYKPSPGFHASCRRFCVFFLCCAEVPTLLWYGETQLE